MATRVQTHAYTEAAGKTEHPPSSLSPSFSLSWAVQFPLLFSPSVSHPLSLLLFVLLSLSHKLHNVPLSSCSGLLLCSMQTNCSEPTSDIIPLSLRCHLHHGAWSRGREGRESRGRRRRRDKKRGRGWGRERNLWEGWRMCGLALQGWGYCMFRHQANPFFSQIRFERWIVHTDQIGCLGCSGYALSVSNAVELNLSIKEAWSMCVLIQKRPWRQDWDASAKIWFESHFKHIQIWLGSDFCCPDFSPEWNLHMAKTDLSWQSEQTAIDTPRQGKQHRRPSSNGVILVWNPQIVIRACIYLLF